MPRKAAPPEKVTRKDTAPKRPATKSAGASGPAAARTAVAEPKVSATPPATAPASPAAAKTQQVAPEAAPQGACPRCGTMKFAPEQRIRAEGNRTVRYTILVCERGHTFARPTPR